MSDKLSSLLFILALICTVTFMSWQDMNYKPSEDASKKTISNVVMSYYAGKDAIEDIIPEDSRPLIIYAGKFITKNGKVVFNTDGMKPSTFAQRQVNLLFDIKDIPQNKTTVINTIKKEIKKWSAVGNDIPAIFMDHNPKKPDFDAHVKLVKEIKESIKPSLYHFVPVINFSWVKDKKKFNYLKLADVSTFFLLKMKEKEVTDKNLKTLENIGYSFQILMPKGYDASAIDIKQLSKNRFFNYSVAYLDPKKSIKKEEFVIGVLPKFLSW